MKRTIALILLVCAFLLCSCSGGFSDEEASEYLKDILEVPDDLVGYKITDETGKYNPSYSEYEKWEDPSAEATKTIELFGKEYVLQYQYTSVSFLDKEPISITYVVEGSEADKIVFYADGSIKTVTFDVATINILPMDTPEKVYEELKPFLEQIVDPSEYEHIKLPEYDLEQIGFSRYTFELYNMIDGEYQSDNISITVEEDGSVSRFSIRKFEMDDSEVDIDKKMEEKLIFLKMDDMYSSYNVKSYKIHGVPHFTSYNNELYVQYCVSGDLLDKDANIFEQNDTSSGFIHIIIIPLRLLTKK